MANVKRVGTEHIAYGEVKFTEYSRAYVGKAQKHLQGMITDEGKDVLDVYKQCLETYEMIGQDLDGQKKNLRLITNAELEQMVELEGSVRFLLTDDDYAGITDPSVIDDLTPKFSGLVKLMRETQWRNDHPDKRGHNAKSL